VHEPYCSARSSGATGGEPSYADTNNEERFMIQFKQLLPSAEKSDFIKSGLM
jgi:hypothetical protein